MLLARDVFLTTLEVQLRLRFEVLCNTNNKKKKTDPTIDFACFFVWLLAALHKITIPVLKFISVSLNVIDCKTKKKLDFVFFLR